MTDEPDGISVFVSYSWDFDEHQEWVIRIAEAIEREPDLNVTFDQFDLWFGKDLTHFMDRGLECERIVIVSTPSYVEKARERKGGVGYESSVITADLVRDMAQDKFIPILRAGDTVPSFLSSKVRADFRNDEIFEREFARLLAAIRRQAPIARPPKRVGSSTPPTYTHSPPAPRPLKPASLMLSISSGSRPSMEVTVTNNGDLPALNVRLAVEFSPAPRFVVDFGTLEPDESRAKDFAEAAGHHNADYRSFEQQFLTALTGKGDPNHRFLMLHEDEDGTQRAVAIIFVREGKTVKMQAAPVTIA